MTAQPASHQTRGPGTVWLTVSGVRRFLRSEEAILILVHGECPHCARLVADVGKRLDRSGQAGIKIGTFVVDRPGARRFRCDNPWLGGLDVFPYAVRYRRGRRVAVARGASSALFAALARSSSNTFLNREAA